MVPLSTAELFLISLQAGVALDTANPAASGTYQFILPNGQQVGFSTVQADGTASTAAEVQAQLAGMSKSFGTNAVTGAFLAAWGQQMLAITYLLQQGNATVTAFFKSLVA